MGRTQEQSPLSNGAGREKYRLSRDCPATGARNFEGRALLMMPSFCSLALLFPGKNSRIGSGDEVCKRTTYKTSVNNLSTCCCRS
ncbi:hypothetical protein CEXT_539011 [Caerostris extrusa]|uniref:Uncharacterized protein n=1 Tax=Caerostris extrusa TaxID=172846 RepID=A0AAV4Y0T9_CAEEX|nr:hypothetical protein CEXT_539011 [Caerostris extrusa]